MGGASSKGGAKFWGAPARPLPLLPTSLDEQSISRFKKKYFLAGFFSIEINQSDNDFCICEDVV